MKIERTDEGKWMEFEHALNYLLCELKTEATLDDLSSLNLVKQSIICFILATRFGDNNEAFTANNKRFFYEELNNIEKYHADTKHSIQIIKDFVEEFLLVD